MESETDGWRIGSTLANNFGSGKLRFHTTQSCDHMWPINCVFQSLYSKNNNRKPLNCHINWMHYWPEDLSSCFVSISCFNIILNSSYSRGTVSGLRPVDRQPLLFFLFFNNTLAEQQTFKTSDGKMSNFISFILIHFLASETLFTTQFVQGSCQGYPLSGRFDIINWGCKFSSFGTNLRFVHSVHL